MLLRAQRTTRVHAGPRSLQLDEHSQRPGHGRTQRRRRHTGATVCDHLGGDGVAPFIAFTHCCGSRHLLDLCLVARCHDWAALLCTVAQSPVIMRAVLVSARRYVTALYVGPERRADHVPVPHVQRRRVLRWRRAAGRQAEAFGKHPHRV